MKIALLVIDMQKAYCDDDSRKSMLIASEYINEVADYFRRAKLPVVWVQNLDEEDGITPGTPGFEIIDELEPLPNEERVHKTYGNSFNKTNLQELLGNTDTLILSGFCAENCVLSTYKGAEDLDYTPILLKNGIASGDQENLRFVEKICHTVSYSLLGKMLQIDGKL